MEKILIISYRFPPADETGTDRAKALAQYLVENNYFPIFITRNWDKPLRRYEDIFEPSGDEVRYESTSTYENYVLPFKDSWILKRNRKNRNGIFTRFLNLANYVFLYFNSFYLSQYRVFLKQAMKIAQRERIKMAIVITDPYPLFLVGYKLNKKLGVRWIADYRDDWTTREVQDTYGFKPNVIHKAIYKLMQKMEKRWVGTASYITSVSDEYASRPSAFVGVPGHTIYNGYFEEEINKITSPPPSKSVFKIVHSGTLYPLQNIEMFLACYKRIVDEFKGEIQFKLDFLGITYKKGSTDRIKAFMKDYEDCYTCSDRVGKKRLFEEISQAQLALVIAFGPGYRGVVPSKIFDYIGLSKPILCCNPDNDAVQHILTHTNLGLFCENEEATYRMLRKCVLEFLANGRINVTPNKEAVHFYSRRNQTKLISKLLDRITD